MSLDNKADIGEQLFEAIETICAGMISTLSFDKTIKCSIEDDSNKENGEYTVFDGSTNFIAYSKIHTFKKDDVVLVQIPQNDMENTKTIIGLTAIENFDIKYYVSPLDSIITLEENDILSNEIKPQLAANSPIQAFLIKSFQNDDIGDFTIKNFQNYTKFGIKINFKIDLRNIVKSGDYSILIRFTGDTDTNLNQTINYQMTFDDFFGDPYSYPGIPTQEKVFDISIFTKIIKCEIYLIQNSNFKDYSNLDINITYNNSAKELSKENTFKIFNAIKNNENITDYNDILKDILGENWQSYDQEILLNKFIEAEDKNISIENFSIYLGYGVEDYNETTPIIFTSNSLTFSQTEKDDKNIQTRIVRILDEETGEKKIYNNSKELKDDIDNNNWNISIYQYKYNPTLENEDLLAGNFWQPIGSYNDKVYETQEDDSTKIKLYDTDFLAALDSIKFIEDLNNNIDNYFINKEDQTELAKILKENSLEIVQIIQLENLNKDSLKKYLIENKEFKEEEIDDNLLDLFINSLNDNKYSYEELISTNEDGEEIKYYIRVIKRYPNLINENEILDILNYSLSVNSYSAEIEKTKVIICTNDRTHIQRTTSKAIQQENGSFEMQSVEENYYELLTQFYSSNEILFTNLDKVESLEFNLIRNFDLIPQEPYNGKFLIFDENDQILIGKETIPASGQKITAKFNLLSPGLSDTIQFKIRWKIPVNNTMIVSEDTKKQKIKISIDEEQKEQLLIWKLSENLDYYESDWIEEEKKNEKETFSVESIFTYIFNNTYNSNYTNNTIICEVQRENGIIVSKSIDLIFGKAGNNGTSYTLIAQLGKKYIPTEYYKNQNELFYILDLKEETDSTFISLPNSLYDNYWIELKQELLDINKNKIELNLEDFTWEFENNESNLSDNIIEKEVYIEIKELFSRENFNDLLTQYGKLYYQKLGSGIIINEIQQQTYSMEEVNEENINSQKHIYYKIKRYFLEFQFDEIGNLIQKEHQHAILKLSVEYSSKKLISYIPLGFYNINNDLENNNSFIGYTGLSTITYDNYGGNPTYYRNEHYLRGLLGLKENLDWRILYKNNDNWENVNNNFYPMIISDNKSFQQLSLNEAKNLFIENKEVNTYANSWYFYQKIENYEQFNEEKKNETPLYKLNLLKEDISYEDYISRYLYRYVVGKQFTDVIETEEQFNKNSPLYKISNIESNFWRKVYDKEEFDIEELIFYNLKVKTPKVQVPTLLIENLLNTPIVIEAYNVNNYVVWSQSILIQKNAYGNQMLNEWDGNLSVDSENNKILSALIGAGIKNDNNSFTGILMGEVKEENSIEDNSNGLFGYNKGNLSFGFRSDGSAFLGEAGKGRIIFNPEINQAIIRSDNFNDYINDLKETSGSEWNLTDSSFKLYGDAVTNDTKAYSLSKLIINSKPEKDGEDFFGLYTTIEENDEIQLIPLLAYKKGEIQEEILQQGEFFLQSEGYYLKNKQDTTIIKDLRNEMEDDFLFDGVKKLYGKPCLNLDFKNGEIVAEKGIIGGFGISSERLFSQTELPDGNYNKVQISTYGLYDIDPSTTFLVEKRAIEVSDKINLKISENEYYELIIDSDLAKEAYFKIENSLIKFKNKEDVLKNSFTTQTEFKKDCINSTELRLDDNGYLQLINLSSNVIGPFNIYIKGLYDNYYEEPLFENCWIKNEQTNYTISKTDDYICIIDFNIQLQNSYGDTITGLLLKEKMSERFPDASDQTLIDFIKNGGLVCKIQESQTLNSLSGKVEINFAITGQMFNTYGISKILNALDYTPSEKLIYSLLISTYFLTSINSENLYGFFRPAFQTGVFDSDNNVDSSFEVYPQGIVNFNIGQTILKILHQSDNRGYINLIINKPSKDYETGQTVTDYFHKIQHIELKENYILDYILSNQFLTLQTKDVDSETILSTFNFDLLNNIFKTEKLNFNSFQTNQEISYTLGGIQKALGGFTLNGVNSNSNSADFWRNSLFTNNVIANTDGTYTHYVGFLRAVGSDSKNLSNVFIGVRQQNKETWPSSSDWSSSNAAYNFYIRFDGKAGFKSKPTTYYYQARDYAGLSIINKGYSFLPALSIPGGNGTFDISTYGYSSKKIDRLVLNYTLNEEEYDEKQLNVSKARIIFQYTPKITSSEQARDCHIRPDHNGYIDLGHSNYRWGTIYSVNGLNTSSDIRLKNIQNSFYLENLIKVYDSINPIAYKWKNDEEDSLHDRIHIGLSSQELEEKMLENNLTRLDFGGLCIDPVYDEDGNLIDESYSLRYGEFHGLHILKNHQQDEEIKLLKEKISILEDKIIQLESNFNN